MKRFLLATILIFLVVSARAEIVTEVLTPTSGTCTMITEILPNIPFTRYTFDWLSDASGNCTITIPQISGQIVRVVTNPDGGATSPTASYDITLADADGIDLLGGLAADRSASTSEQIAPIIADGDTSPSMVVMSASTLAVTSAGAANGGIVRLYVRTR